MLETVHGLAGFTMYNLYVFVGALTTPCAFSYTGDTSDEYVASTLNGADYSKPMMLGDGDMSVCANANCFGYGILNHNQVLGLPVPQDLPTCAPDDTPADPIKDGFDHGGDWVDDEDFRRTRILNKTLNNALNRHPGYDVYVILQETAVASDNVYVIVGCGLEAAQGPIGTTQYTLYVLIGSNERPCLVQYAGESGRYAAGMSHGAGFVHAWSNAWGKRLQVFEVRMPFILNQADFTLFGDGNQVMHPFVIGVYDGNKERGHDPVALPKVAVDSDNAPIVNVTLLKNSTWCGMSTTGCQEDWTPSSSPPPAIITPLNVTVPVNTTHE